MSGAGQVAALRQRLAVHGRHPDSLKILHGSLVILGRTREEVKAKVTQFGELMSVEGEYVVIEA